MMLVDYMHSSFRWSTWCLLIKQMMLIDQTHDAWFRSLYDALECSTLFSRECLMMLDALECSTWISRKGLDALECLMMLDDAWWCLMTLDDAWWRLMMLHTRTEQLLLLPLATWSSFLLIRPVCWDDSYPTPWTISIPCLLIISSRAAAVKHKQTKSD